MKENLDKALVSAFPNLYRDRNADMTNTCMCWGFEVGNGWFNLIWDLSSKLEPLIIQEQKDENRLNRRIKRYVKNFLYWFKVYKLGITSFKMNKVSWKEYQENYCQLYFPCASQVKEKFGTLRFYMNCETEEMSRLINEAEIKSYVTCENCGDIGELDGDGWLSVLCDKCRKERNK